MGMLSTRTPWVFLVDPQGVVRFEAHGRRIAALDSVVRALAVGRDGGAPGRFAAATSRRER
jgi:hypothetical protein